MLWDDYLERRIDEIPYGTVDSILDEMEDISQGEPDESERELTPSMIQEAREVPIQSVVQFVNGLARCWEHEDKKPSVYIGSRTNKAFCPVCAKSWNPIDVLITRDGVSFPAAVKELLNL